MDDLISRKQAIDAAMQDASCIRTHEFNAGATRAANRIKRLPSAQSEIIHCEDCKHFIREDVEEYTPYGYNTHFHAFCDKHWDGEHGEYIDVKLDDFCSFAERRED